MLSRVVQVWVVLFCFFRRWNQYWSKFVELRSYLLPTGTVKMKYFDAGIIQKLVLTQNDYLIFQSLWNLMTLRNFNHNKKIVTWPVHWIRGETSPNANKIPIISHKNHKVQNNFHCSQVPCFNGASLHHWLTPWRQGRTDRCIIVDGRQLLTTFSFSDKNFILQL